jgi:hypothetical protein
MSNSKLRIHNTETDNLVSNLRGEVGEIISTWVMMRNFMVQANQLKTADYLKDLENPQLALLNTLIDKLEDEIISRLAELAEHKTGRLTFYFAHLKINALEKEVSDFTRFIRKNRFEEKRNYDISHKELPEKWTDHKSISIPYFIVLKGVASAFWLMKKIDEIYLGPRAKYLWLESRKRRYKPMYPAKVGYMILPHVWLSNEDRIKIIQEEMQEGREIWKDMPIKINGKDVVIKTYGEFGAIILGGRIVLLDSPFVELTSIDIPVKNQV